MSTFTARLHVPGQTKVPLNVEVDIAEETLILKAADQVVAEWTLTDLEVEVRSDGIHIVAENEEIVLTTPDAAKLAIELGVRKTAPASPRVDTGGGLGRRSLNGASVNELRIEDLKRRVEEVADAINSDAIAPADAFAQWLRLLKELNRRHGHGSIPTHQFYELNTELLDLIPVSKPGPVSAPQS